MKCKLNSKDTEEKIIESKIDLNRCNNGTGIFRMSNESITQALMCLVCCYFISFFIKFYCFVSNFRYQCCLITKK